MRHLNNYVQYYTSDSHISLNYNKNKYNDLFDYGLISQTSKIYLNNKFKYKFSLQINLKIFFCLKIDMQLN